ncbi:MAG TPA: hypothetical protein VHJ20_06550 [Polyangia bacterium]|nr:hypothetical protein [Polyangia bacterium]
MSADSTISQDAAVTVPPAEDLFSLARRANAARDAALGRRGTFTRSRRLLATGAWRGPRDAVLSYVETADLAALGGWAAAREAGATALVGADVAALREAGAVGARLIAHLPFRSGESETDRLARLRALAAARLPLWGVIPTPEGEPYGLDTLRFTALCRLELPGVAHVIADVEALGPRLAQMSLGFGADELLAQIMSERALRLGDNANTTVLTRGEAITLIKGAGLAPAERLANDQLEEHV